MSCKYVPEPYNSRGFDIELSPEDIGMEQPKDLESFKKTLHELQFHAAKAVHLFLLKEGAEDKDKALQTLKVYRE